MKLHAFPFSYLFLMQLEYNQLYEGQKKNVRATTTQANENNIDRKMFKKFKQPKRLELSKCTENRKNRILEIRGRNKHDRATA